MHIPDGYLGPETVAAGWAACVPAWYIANRKAKAALTEPRAVPLLAASAAFSFLIMLLNIPVLGGTTAHAVGAVLIAVIAGPWIAVLAVTAALVIQALLFADGGLLALGVNCLNMAVAMPLVGYAVYVVFAGRAPLLSLRRLAAVAVAAYAGSITAAALTGLELGIQPALHSVNGVPQYAPYGLGVALAAMVGSHALVAGPVEAVFTVTVYAFLARTSPDLLLARGAQLRARTRWLWGLVAALVVIAPLGLIASGAAWGEWNGRQLQDRLGFVPHGVGRFDAWWRGVLPRYGLPGGSHGAVAALVYIVAALLGVAALTLLVRLLVGVSRRANDSTRP
jgi:cobalt/nickel transport system permease protein